MKKNKTKDQSIQQEQYFQALFQQAPVPYQSLDAQGHILDVNQAWLEKMGYERQEVIGRWFGDFLSNEYHGIFMERFPCFKSLGMVCGVEFKMQRKDGTFFLSSFEGKIGKDEQGNFKQTHCIFTDITKQKQIELELTETAERFKALHNASFGGIAIHDKGRILECNQGLSEITGYSVDELTGGMDGLLLIAPEAREMVMNKIVMGYEKPYEAIGLRKNGQKYPIRLEGRNIPYKGKNVRTVEFRDITIDKQNKEEIVKQTYLLERAQDIGHIGSWDLDVSNNVLKWSKENYKIFELETGTPLTYELFLSRVHPDDREYVNMKWQAALNRQPYEVIHRLLINGLVKWVWQKAELEFDAHGSCIRAIGFTQDITERKKNEKEIENINELLLLYIENSPIYTFIKSVTSIENRVVLASNNFNEIIGGSVRNINGKTMHELFPAEFANKIIEDDWNIIVSGKMLKIDENFGERNYTSIKFPIIQGDRKLLAGYTIDITELKQAEEVAKKEQALSNVIIESIPGAFYMLDETGKYVRWNAYQRDEIVGKPDALVGSTNALDTIHPDDRGLIQSKIANVLATGAEETVEGRVLLCGGPAFRWLLMTGRRMLIEGRPFLIGIGIDITERKQAEAALQVSNKRFEELFNNMSSGVVIYTAVDKGADFIIKDFNKAAEKIENISKVDLIDKRITEVFPGVNEFGLFDVFQQVFKTGNPEHLAAKIYQDNRIIGWRQNYVFKIPTGEIIAVYDDVTEEKKIEQQEKEIFAAQAALLVEKRKAEELKIMQEQLLQSEKMASIGQLGAGVAHELNSPLAGILSLLQSYKKEKDSNSEEYRDLAEMEKAAEHMTKIIKDLNVFSRQSTGDIEEVDCNEAINSTLSFTEYQFKQKKIKVEKKLNSDLWKIRVNKNQIQQIVINMISNACDASFANGIFRIVTNNIKINDKAYVEMLFEDKGKGISKENLKKIFDPFFTTKRPGGGVGLGLSIVYKIIDNHKGTIAVDSTEGQGTIFTVRLPIN